MDNQLKKVTITITADGDGNGSATSSEIINGRVEKIKFANSSVGTPTTIVKSANELETIYSKASEAPSGWKYPRKPAQDIAGAAVTYDGTNEIYEPFYINDTLTLSCSSATEAGTITATVYWV